MKKILALVISLIICIPLFGCNEQMKIKIACDEEIINSDFITRAVEYYETHSNATVEIVKYTKSSLKDKSVDVIIHPMDADMVEFGMAENFYDFSGETWVNDIPDYCYDSVMHEGKVYGFPFGTSSITGCYYNKTLFNELGLGIPGTQAEFDALCDALKAIGITPLGVSGTNLSMIAYEIGFEQMLSKRPAYVKELNTGKITMAEIPGASTVADWWKKADGRGWFGDDWYNMTDDAAADKLGDGYAAMVICDDKWINEKLGAGNVYKSVDFALMPMFMGNPEGAAIGSDVHVIAVKKDNVATGVALGFVTMISDPDVYNQCFSGTYTVPVLKDQEGIIVPDQFEAFDKDAVVTMSAFYPRINNYSHERGAKAIVSYIKNEITVDECLKELGNGK